MQPSFVWTCSYQGCTWFRVHDSTGTYEAELRRSCPDYELAVANGDSVRREMVSAVGILRRSHSVASGGAPGRGYRCFEVPAETVAAFNAWRAAEHAAQLARLRAAPGRYGVIADSDPLAIAPAPAVQGRFNLESGLWERAPYAVPVAA